MLVVAAIFIGWAAVLLIFSGARTPLGHVIYTASPSALNSFQAGIQRYIGPELWDWVFLPILEQPAVACFAGSRVSYQRPHAGSLPGRQGC